jgi:hypothetical protein
MRKTFCDRGHAAECTSRIGRLHLSVIHQTNKGETVSEDEYRPMDLCGDCVDELLNTFLAGRDPLPMMKAVEDYPMDTAPPPVEGWDRATDGPPERALVTGYPQGERSE